MSVINFVTVCGGIFAFLFVTMEIPLLVPPNDLFCKIYNQIKTFYYGGAGFCAYFALWYRIDSVFYRNSIVRQSISKPLQVLNYTAITFIVLMVGINLSIFLFDPANLILSVPCACQAVSSNKNNFIKWILLAASAIASQFILLFTFIYPLYLHRKKMLNRQTDQRSIIPVIKRASVVAGVCIVSDLLSFVYSVFSGAKTLYIHHVVYSCNLIVNLTGVVFTFANWREKLLPCKKSNIQTGSSSKSIDCYSKELTNAKAITNVQVTPNNMPPPRSAKL